ncbi:oxygenase MpaB family protein [Mycobacterium shimoidei]|nr:oxygenase MpaB family protein [Mycobacterium shimoidei]
MNVFMRLLAPGDVRATVAQRESFRRFANMGDPLADAVVAMMQRLPTGEGRRMFETAVDQGIDAVEDPPEELVAFFAQVDDRPYWLDQAKLDLAVRVTMRTGLWGIALALPGLALTGGYLASKADKPLVGTGDLRRMAPRRLNETATWFIDVTSPDGLDRFAPGFTGTLRVRLMHAMVRAAMARRDDWDFAAWDHPVNQVQLAGTLMLFSLANLAGCQAMGVKFSRRERDAVFHFWRYVGLLMGVHPELIPATEDDTWRLFWLEADTEFLPDQDSYRLAQALHSGPPDEDPLTALARTYLSSYSRLVLGRSHADQLGLPDNKPLQAAVLATSAINRMFELRRFIPGATRLSEELGQWSRRRFVERGFAATGGDRTYRRHDALAVAG